MLFNMHEIEVIANKSDEYRSIQNKVVSISEVYCSSHLWKRKDIKFQNLKEIQVQETGNIFKRTFR
jgi:hypothetical protein